MPPRVTFKIPCTKCKEKYRNETCWNSARKPGKNSWRQVLRKKFPEKLRYLEKKLLGEIPGENVRKNLGVTLRNFNVSFGNSLKALPASVGCLTQLFVRLCSGVPSESFPKTIPESICREFSSSFSRNTSKDILRNSL